MISIKSKSEIEIMRAGGKILAGIMKEIEKNIAPGKSAAQINKLAEKLVLSSGAKPIFKGYGKETGNPFPFAICASLNSEIVHGFSVKEKILKEGDLFKVDIGLKFKGFCSDMARTFAVGEVSREARRLMEVTEKSFWEGIKQVKAGNMLSDYSKSVQNFVEKRHGFSLVRNLVGHGIGRQIHEDPRIPNYYEKKYQDFELVSGMTLAFEPMVNAGRHETILDSDGWTFRTKDGSLAAHYENTVAVTDKGAEVLTFL